MRTSIPTGMRLRKCTRSDWPNRLRMRMSMKQNTEMQSSQLSQARKVYLRVDRLAAALDEVISARTDGKSGAEARAAYLGVPYYTYWRYTRRERNGRAHVAKQVTAHFMYAVLRAFPNATHDHFFSDEPVPAWPVVDERVAA